MTISVLAYIEIMNDKIYHITTIIVGINNYSISKIYGCNKNFLRYSQISSPFIYIRIFESILKSFYYIYITNILTLKESIKI